MLPFILTSILLLLYLSVIPVYIYLGYRLKENMLRWGRYRVRSFGCSSVSLCAVISFLNARFMLFFWTLVQCISAILALSLAFAIAYRKGLVTKHVAYIVNRSL